MYLTIYPLPIYLSTNLPREHLAMVTNGSWARLGGDSVAGQLDILRTYRGLGLNSEQVSGHRRGIVLIKS